MSAGRSSSIDANLNVLKERMEMVKVKEQLERCCRSTQNGWNYININNNYELYDHQLLMQMKRRTKHKDLLSNLVDLSLLVCGTLGFTCLSGTLFLCLLSLIFHLQIQLWDLMLVHFILVVSSDFIFIILKKSIVNLSKPCK